jgi:hypothetical protein
VDGGDMAVLTRRALLGCGVAMGVLGAWIGASGAALTEAQLKAGFLYNFAQFVEWPARSDDDAFVIGVMGNVNFDGALEQMKGRDVNGRKIDVQFVDEQDDVSGCAILFIAAPDDRATASALARVGRSPVLTVGESARFTKLGGIIRLYKENDKLRFEVNVTRAQSAGLRISSKMLGLARITKEGS